jgi:hypothetical protein
MFRAKNKIDKHQYMKACIKLENLFIYFLELQY